LRVQCLDSLLEIPYTGISMSRANLGILVVVMDVLIVLSFILGYHLLGYFERLENLDYYRSEVLTEDFAVCVKRIPPSSS